MPVDDLPDPAPGPPADDADTALLADIAASEDAFRWVKAALSVLQADVNPEGPDTLPGEAIRQMRVEAGRLIARVFRLVVPDNIEA